MNTIICTKCKEELPATSQYFRKRKKAKYGLKQECKTCCKLVEKKYREKQTTKLRRKIYYNDNKENISKKRKQHYQENKESINQRQKEYNKKKTNKKKLSI